MTPVDLVLRGLHEILLHDMGEEELPFMATGELDCIRRVWLRAFLAFLTRDQQDLKRTQKECKGRVVCTQSENCTYGGNYIQMEFVVDWRCACVQDIPRWWIRFCNSLILFSLF